jgi:NADH-quinone oxidoreductase subunit F
MPKVLTNRFAIKDSHTLSVYKEHNGYKTIDKLFATKPADIIEEVKKSGLRGRGGAGFPAGMKWGFIPKGGDKPVYLCVNADESEPGTFKDRYLLEKDPHQLIEGIIICAYAVGCHHAYIYIRGEFDLAYRRIQEAVDEAYAQGVLGETVCGKEYKLEVTVHRGAGAYICGEETALLESIEGKRGNPRTKPPFPAIVGLFNSPTVINNVETLSALPFIFDKGPEAYRQWGTDKSPGTKLFCVSGHVKKPGVYELPLGYPLKDLLEKECGGIAGTGRLKAVVTGGSSVPVLTAEEAYGAHLDYEALMEKGTMLGSGGVIVMDDSVDMLWTLRNLAYFYAHESCGQCTPCREGSGWTYKILDRLYREGGSEKDLKLLVEIADNMVGKTICVLADALAMPVKSYIKKFREDFEKSF